MASVMHTNVSGYKISVYNSSHFMVGQAKDVLATVAKKVVFAPLFLCVVAVRYRGVRTNP